MQVNAIMIVIIFLLTIKIIIFLWSLFQVLKSSKSIADPCTPTQRARLELSAEKVVPFVRHELLTLRRRSKEVKEGLRKGRYVRSLA